MHPLEGFLKNIKNPIFRPQNPKLGSQKNFFENEKVF
jgi:hypothetical protein